MTIQRLKIDDLEITVVRKPIKNMYLRVRRHGEIEISASPRVEIETIESFIQAKKPWILKKREAILNSPRHVVSTDEILYFGHLLKLRRQVGSKVFIEIIENDIVITAPKSYTDEKVILAVKNCMFIQLKEKINAYVMNYWPYFQEKGIAPIEIKYRQMTSTWGVCRPTKGTITFSKQLIHQPDTFIEYVVVHELCHLLQPNHSAHFYALVENLLPNWKLAESHRI